MAKSKSTTKKSISELVRNFRSLRMHLLVPPGPEANELLQHLRRMGCIASTSWPPPVRELVNVDVVFISIRPLVEGQASFIWDVDDPPAALIAIADYENPLMVEKTLALQAHSTIAMPLRPFGVLTDVLLSVANFKREEQNRKDLARLAIKVRISDNVEKAKAIIAERNGISMNAAYSVLRQKAMNNRTPLSAVVEFVVNEKKLP